MNGQITALYASLIGLLLVYLSMRVAMNRRRKSIGVGDKGDPEMTRIIRVHGNLVEYAPIALLLLFFCEAQGMSSGIIHFFGITLVVARVLHAIGLNGSAGYSLPRFVGALATFLIIVLLSGLNVFHYFFH